MGLFSLKPSRMQAKESEPEIVSDLDALESKPVYFRFRGKVRQLKPLSVQGFYKFSGAYLGLMEKKDIPAEDVFKRFVDIVQAVCPDISAAELATLTSAQSIALFNLITESVTGKAFAETEKKKVTDQASP